MPWRRKRKPTPGVCLESPVHRRAWRAAVRGVAKSPQDWGTRAVTSTCSLTPAGPRTRQDSAVFHVYDVLSHTGCRGRLGKHEPPSPCCWVGLLPGWIQSLPDQGQAVIRSQVPSQGPPATSHRPYNSAPRSSETELDTKGFIMKTPASETDLTIFQILREPNKTCQWNLARGPLIRNLAFQLSVLPSLSSGFPSFQSESTSLWPNWKKPSHYT